MPLKGTYSGRPFHIMAKPAGPLCNLECSYCFYLEKENLYPGIADFRMNDEVLESYVRQQIVAQPGSHVSFAWQGGEPALLGIKFYRKAAALQQGLFVSSAASPFLELFSLFGPL